MWGLDETCGVILGKVECRKNQYQSTKVPKGGHADFVVEINGVVHTSESLLNTHFHSLLTQTAPDMNSFAQALHARLHHMSLLGIFKSVNILLDAPSELLLPGDHTPVDVILELEEKPRLFLKTGTEFSKNEANLVCIC